MRRWRTLTACHHHTPTQNARTRFMSRQNASPKSWGSQTNKLAYSTRETRVFGEFELGAPVFELARRSMGYIPTACDTPKAP